MCFESLGECHRDHPIQPWYISNFDLYSRAALPVVPMSTRTPTVNRPSSVNSLGRRAGLTNILDVITVIIEVDHN